MPGNVGSFFSLTPAAIRAALHAMGRHPKKYRGQNFLHSASTVARMLDLCRLQPDDVVLEIGPGLGALTLNMAAVVQRVIAIEIEPSFLPFLEREASARGLVTLEVVQGDALTVDFPAGVTKIVSSLPYSISAPLTFKIMHHVVATGATAFLLCQKEFGEKLIARPGTRAYSRIAANASLLACVSMLVDVSRNNFYPVPAVDSCFVSLEPRTSPPPVPPATVMAVTRHLFPFKNKTVGKAVKLCLEKVEAPASAVVEMDLARFGQARVRDLDEKGLLALVGMLTAHVPGGGNDEDPGDP